MNEISCGVMGDLLPLYAENMTSPESAALVEAHLPTCPQCAQQLERLRQPVKIPADTAELHLVRMKYYLWKRTVAICMLLLSIALFAMGFAGAWLLHPIAVQAEELDFDFERQSDEELTVTITGEAIDCSVWLDGEVEEGASVVAVIQAHTNRFNRYFGEKRVWTKNLGRFDAINAVFYVPPDAEIDANNDYNGGKMLYGASMSVQPATWFPLPRLAPAFYLLCAGAACAAGGILWLVFRKRKAALLFQIIALLGASYLLAHLCVLGTSLSTINLSFDFCAMAALTVPIFGILFTLPRAFYHPRNL
jgi:hypothetical protein